MRRSPGVDDARVRASVRLITWALLAFSCAACNGASTSTQSTVPIDGRVLAFMECEECIQGERARVVQMGDTAVQALREALSHGPNPHRVAIVDSSLRQFTKPPPSQAAIAYQLRIFRALYARRSALALGLIGTPAAKAALCEARQFAPLSPAERAAVDSSLAMIGGTCP
ncbi:MAG: hypothetical protein ABIW79_07490 [Gemmatimonas sp.]